MKYKLGVAVEDIPKESLYIIGGSGNTVALVSSYEVGDCGEVYFSTRDIEYGDFIEISKSIRINNKHNKNKECILSDRIATGTAYASSVVTIFASAWSFNELMAFAGLIIGVATFLYNIWFKERTLKVDREYKMALLQEVKNKEVISVPQEMTDIN